MCGDAKYPGAAWLVAGVAACLSALVLLQGWGVRATTSATYDETFYRDAARESLGPERLDRRLAPEGVAPVPVVVAWLPVARALQHDARSTESIDVRMVRTARAIACAAVGVPLVLTVFSCMLLRRGLVAGAVAGALCAGSPTVMAHASLATTDACFALTVLLALSALASLAARPRSIPRWLVAGLACGTAVASKYTGLFLLPVAAVALAVGAWQARGLSARSRRVFSRRLLRAAIVGLGSVLVLAALVSIVCWAWHGFGFAVLGPTFELHRWPRAWAWPWPETWIDRELPSPLVGLLFQWVHGRGHPAYLLGEYRATGWWYYFPYAAFFKSSPVELLLALGACAQARGMWVRRSSRSPEDRSRDHTLLVWGTAAAIYALMMLTVRVQIGQRYLLPLYPLVILLGIDALFAAHGWVARRRGWIAAALVLGQVASAASIAPQYLAYFSPLVGGPSNGHRLLADSNIDWGQDLPRLKAELDRRGWRRVVLCYFGTADPEAYGIAATRPADLSRDPVPVGELDRYDALAISLTNLLGVYADPPGRGNRPLLAIAPTARVGYSIFLYDLHDGRVRAAVRKARGPCNS